eukprot:1978713-Amphidinium_carterae.1
MDGSRAVGVRVPAVALRTSEGSPSILTGEQVLVKDSDTQAGAEVRSVLARKEVAVEWHLRILLHCSNLL